MDEDTIKYNSYDEEYENLSEHEKKICDIREKIENIDIYLEQANEEYEHIWNTVFVPYLKENNGSGILNKLNPDRDSIKFNKFLMNSSTEYNKRIKEREQLYTQLNRLVKKETC